MTRCAARISAGDRRVLRGRRVRAHLRECRACAAFAAAIPARRAELRAFTPVLPAAAAAACALALAACRLRPWSVRSRRGLRDCDGGSRRLAVGKAAGTAVLWKAATGVAVIATAAAGVTGLGHVLQHHLAPAKSAIRAGERRGVAVSQNRAAGSHGLVTRSATSTGAAGVAHGVGAGRRARSAANASGVGVPGFAARASGASGHGKARASHGTAETAVNHRGGAGKSTTHSRSHSSAGAKAPATQGRPAGHGRTKSRSGHSGGVTHASTNSHPRVQPPQSHGGRAVTVTTPRKP